MRGAFFDSAIDSSPRQSSANVFDEFSKDGANRGSADKVIGLAVRRYAAGVAQSGGGGLDGR